MPAAKPPFPILQRGDPLARGLVGAWPFYEGSGLTVNDLSGQGNTGTLSGGVTWAGGQSGWALKFDGSTGYVQTTAFQLNSSSVTMAAWAQSAWGSAINEMLFCKGAVNAEWELFFESGFIKIRGGGVGSPVQVAQPTDSGWHHFAGTISGTTGTIYVDGVPVVTGTVVALSDVSSSLRLGSFPGGYFWNGLIDGGCVFNRALSSAEIASLYADSYRMFRDDEDAWLKAAVAPVSSPSYLPLLGVG